MPRLPDTAASPKRPPSKGTPVMTAEAFRDSLYNGMSEAEHGREFVGWAEREQVNRYPELAALHHIPNGGFRKTKPGGKSAAGGKLKAEGAKRGVPDYFLPVPRGGYAGLYVELKKVGGSVSKEQTWWISFLQEQGYAVFVAWGWKEARDYTVRYLQAERPDWLRPLDSDKA